MAEGADERAVELAKFAADAAYACTHYGVIDDAQGHGEGTGTIPFRLWPAQLPVLWSLMRGGMGGRQNPDRLTIILKARQLGISWLCCWYALWRCLLQPSTVVLLFSKGETEAQELLRRIKVLYKRLPDWMREAFPAVVTDNERELVFANGAICRSLAATKSGGRSFTASVVILDEAAFLPWPDELYAALKPTIDGGGQLIVLSTAGGIGNLFHRLWVRAEAGQSGWRAIFLPWWSRPDRDAAWYAAQLAEYDDPALVRQEYPASANEAFLVSGRVRFQPEWIAAQVPNVRPGLDRAQWPAALRALDIAGGTLTVYARPQADRTYALGADVAEGLEHGDYSAATVIDADSWEEVAHLHGHWEPDRFAELLDALAQVYDLDPLVERNNHGHAVLATFKRLGSRPMHGHDDRPGWLTNAQTKPQAIDFLAVALRDGLCRVRTQATLAELQIYRIGKTGDTGAPAGYHDDRVMSWAIALQAARRGKRQFLR